MAARDPATPAGFKKLDLHIHTRFSLCYVDHIKPEANLHTTPEEIVAAAVDAGLDGVAITDHNGGEAIDAAREAARDRGLTILPGTEISTRGGHCLAIFDVDTDVDVIRDLVLALGLERDQWGNGFVATKRWMDEVFAEIAVRGGIAIGAHVDREPRGFLSSDERPSDKQRIYQHPDLAALEITDPARKARYTAGADPRYRQPRACVQSSDAHAPYEVGRRPTLFRMEEVTLDALRAALADFQRSVLFPGEVVE